MLKSKPETEIEIGTETGIETETETEIEPETGIETGIVTEVGIGTETEIEKEKDPVRGTEEVEPLESPGEIALTTFKQLALRKKKKTIRRLLDWESLP